MRVFFLILFFGISILNIPTDAATPRVINGTRAKLEEGPWMAAIIYTNSDSPVKGQFCGGTLIHPSWVLTSAHCTDGENIHSIEILLGRNTLSDNNSGEIIRIKQIIKHPDYDYNPENPTADLALLKLAKPSNQPVLRIAERYSDLISVGDPAIVMGWGATKTSRYNPRYADSLQQAMVPIVSNKLCNAESSYGGDIKETMLCAGFTKGGTDACIGDSGGPLVVETEQGWQQIGIVSWGEGCALPNYYGVYTRLPLFQEYVTEQICQAEAHLATPTLQIEITGHQVTASWSTIKAAEGYQFYYAPYSNPVNEVTFDNIHSFDVGDQTSLNDILSSNTRFYVAVRAYQGNCYSERSNVGTILLD